MHNHSDSTPSMPPRSDSQVWNRLADIDPQLGDRKQVPVWFAKFWQVLRSEVQELRPRLLLSQLLLAALPPFVGNRIRAQVLRMNGFSIGAGTTFWGLPTFTGNGAIQDHLLIGRLCHFNIGCIFDLGARLSIGDHVVVGHQVLLLTTNHEISGPRRRTGRNIPLPVTIGAGCWLGARCIILPGVTVGAGSVVAAGAVVTRDVPPNTLVAGTPARVIRVLDAA